MGLIELFKVASATIKTLRSAPGPAVVITGTGIGGIAREREVFNPAGFASMPPKDAHGLFFPLGGRYGVVIGGHNYKVTISLADGETEIFSTTADGATLKAQIVLGADGKVKVVNDAGKSLKTILTTLIQHVRDLATINCVVGSPVTLNPATIANLNADVTELAALLKD